MTHKPNKVLGGDVTEFNVASSEKKLYLSPVMDLYNSEIKVDRMSQSATGRLTNQSLKGALLVLTKDHELMMHTDQGFHYEHQSWVTLHEHHSICQSMSRRRNYIDHSPMEHFFGLLKQEMFYDEAFESIEQLKERIDTYIFWYNHDRNKKIKRPVTYSI